MMKSLQYQGSVALVFITVGFTLLVTGIVRNLDWIKVILIVVGGVAVYIGIQVMYNVSKQMDIKEQDQNDKLQQRQDARECREEARYQELIKEIKGLREDLKK